MSGEEQMMQGGTPGSNGQEERIFVSVRVRPLNEKEILRNDASDWECINGNSIKFKHNLPDRAMFPSSYTYDRVFGSNCPTKRVYKEGARDVALSAVNGINSSIFAYGQTSSGKTYTMSGITEYAVADIYEYVDMHKEREFVLKFSAMEIYNEAVRDLLSSDNVPLRLLDDPEKGTVVERLTEVTLRDWDHLQKLLSICHAERKIGETSLNETSSRSHQILRLTIESSAHEYIGAPSTLMATVDFVDLAGSERASQTSSAGARLKEGSHINRSLLTLGTVIRKLSKGRTGHVPYRDSKLTRILQNSLVGNARTAIICTMSPAHCHVEQSRNTLLFASCAKEVTTNARVNVVVSDKAMVKQLQRELSRLENELKSLVSNSITYDFAALLKEKDLLIEKMGQEIKELTQQSQLTESRIKNSQQSVGGDQFLRIDEYSISESSGPANPLCLDLGPRTCSTSKDLHGSSVHNSNKDHQQFSGNSVDNLLLDVSTPKFVDPDLYRSGEEIAERADAASEDNCKEVRCIEVEESPGDQNIESVLPLPGPIEQVGQFPLREPLNEDVVTSPQKGPKEATNGDAVTSQQKGPEEATNEDAVTSQQKGSTKATNEDAATPSQKGSEEAMDEDAVSYPQKRSEEVMNEEAVSSPEKVAKDMNGVDDDNTYNDLKQRIQSMQKAINRLISFCPSDRSPSSEAYFLSSTRSSKFARSKSCRAIMQSAHWFEKAEQNENTPPAGSEKEYFPSIKEGPQRSLSAMKLGARSGNFLRKASQNYVKSVSTEEQNSRKSDTEDAKSTPNFTARQSEAAKPQSKRLFNDLERDAAIRTYEHRNSVKDAGVHGALLPGSNWPFDFERQRREIIQLWDACNVPLVHRTFFFLLFKGEPSDAVYLEIELRRLSFLKVIFSKGSSKENRTLTPASRL
ncbi:kinesin-like protein KIN-7I isoform X2 [Corylus avellana]|uniref:kinesin-like protein KIN-7I isoform X2 n=1 Tax=Corylus avellana TaxID=13451 RepID=UPI00286CC392|nr:kinesin-like protein KIN-7I isoform X2 [Corylus avellana]